MTWEGFEPVLLKKGLNGKAVYTDAALKAGALPYYATGTSYMWLASLFWRCECQYAGY